MPDFSFNDIRTMIEAALNPAGDFKNWVQDVYPDKCIVNMSGELYEVPYALKDGKAELGEKKRVKVAYEAFAELRGMEVLQTGTHVSQDGKKVTYTESDLDELMKNSEELKDVVKPPLVVGHSEGDVSELVNAQTVGAPQVGFFAPKLTKKKNDDGSFSLYADVTDVAEKAVDKIGKELKRVSPEIYNNFKYGDKSYGKVLRRVSFVPIPSIKTMAEVTASHLAFGEKPDQPTTWVIFAEEPPRKDGKEKHTMPEIDITKMQEQLNGLTTEVTTLKTEKADLTTKLGEATTKATTLETEKKAAVDKLSEAHRTQRKAEIHAFCENLKRDGKLIPAMQDLGIERFLEQLDDSTVRKFAEEAAKCPDCGVAMEEKDGQMVCPKCGKTAKLAESLSQLGFMKKFMESFGKIVRFGEIASQGKKTDDAAGPGEKLTKLAEGKIADSTKAGKVLQFAEAFEQVQKENPELAQEYAAEVSGKA